MVGTNEQHANKVKSQVIIPAAFAEANAALCRAEDVSRYLYVFQSEAGPIKVGRASNWRARLSQIRGGSPDRIFARAVIRGGDWLENEIHLELARDRRRGEWFNPTPFVLAALARRIWDGDIVEHDHEWLAGLPAPLEGDRS